MFQNQHPRIGISQTLLDTLVTICFSVWQYYCDLEEDEASRDETYVCRRGDHRSIKYNGFKLICAFKGK